ncbi:hypothetical protein Tco_1352887 [Tanacetum coccineum]
MANIRTCNKHNMIACVEKTAQNADFYQIIDYLTGCSINYSLLVDPDLIGPWLQQFWATASLRVINDVPHIRAMVAGKKILISEETIRADLLFDDADGVDCFPKQVLWDSLRDIGYEGNLAQLTFSKPLFSPQWKYLVHVLLHCLSPKSTSWEQFGTNIASALVGLATNQKFNFSLMIMNGMLGHISNGTPFLYVILRAASSARDAQGTPTQSAAQASISTAQDTAGTQSAAQASISTAQDTAGTQGTAPAQDTAEVQATDPVQGATTIPKSPNDYTPTDASQTSGGVRDFFDLFALNGNFLGESQNIRREKEEKKEAYEESCLQVNWGENKEETEKSILRRKRVLIVKCWSTEELDIEAVQSTARTRDFTPRTLNFNDEACPSSPIRPTQNIEPEEQFKVDEVLADISRPRGLSIPGPIQSLSPTSHTIYKLLTRKINGKGILVDEPKNENYYLFNKSEPWRLQMMRRLLERFKLIGDAEKKEKGYKNLQKLKYPQMKELYDKVQESIKDSFKDFIPIDTEREMQMLKERDEKRLLRKRKATISEEQPSRSLVFDDMDSGYGMEVEDESDDSIAVISVHLWTTGRW